jgi:hypothetical protein
VILAFPRIAGSYLRGKQAGEEMEEGAACAGITWATAAGRGSATRR